MGYKWGFFQFPQSPELSAIELPNGTNWRPLDSNYYLVHNNIPGNPCEKNKSELLLSVDFDLSKPLKEQLEQVKQKAIIAQRQLRKKGSLQLFTIAGKKALWMSCLRFLDAQSQQVTVPLNSDNIKFITCEADYYINHYLQILTLMEK